MIRVLHILHSMNRGGAENAIMNYYRHIDRSQIQFDFLLTAQEHTLFEDEIISLGGRIYKVPLLTMAKPWQYIFAVKRFFNSHREYRIVHSHTSSKSVIPLGIAKLSGIPIRCSHSHNTKTEAGFKGWIRNALMPLLKIVATDELACGVDAAKWLYGETAYNNGEITIFKNVIEAEKFRFNDRVRHEIRARYHISDDEIVIGHTARFSAQKNHAFDIDILVALKKKHIKCRLMLLGDGELRNDIINKAIMRKVYDDIIFVGIVSNVYDYEQAFDYFILPSFNEGLPLSIIEAQVSGLPCITSKGLVSVECSVTDLVTYLPIDQGADIWANTVQEPTTFKRKDRWSDIARAGYDAATSAITLQNFYLTRIAEITH